MTTLLDFVEIKEDSNLEQRRRVLLKYDVLINRMKRILTSIDKLTRDYPHFEDESFFNKFPNITSVQHLMSNKLDVSEELIDGYLLILNEIENDVKKIRKRLK
jgi:hypothetical protein